MLNHSPAIKQCHETLPRNKTKGFRAMKHLLIMRHAEAGNSMNPNLRDFDRPLTAHGQNQCAQQRQRLIAQNLYPDLILHSSALRTQQTAQLVAPHQDSKRIASDDLYNGHGHHPNGSYQNYLDIADSLGGNSRCLLLIGHNPVISALATYLHGQGASRDASPDPGLAASYFAPATLMGFAVTDEGRFNQPDNRWQTLFCWTAIGD
jgi:phosphohistidine phosphatase